MSLLEYTVWIHFGQSLLPMIRTILKTVVPYTDPDIDQNDYGIMAALLYIIAYLMWPLILAKLLSKKK